MLLQKTLRYDFTDESQTLLRYNLQPCSLSKPFNEMVVGFYVHTDMDFVVTKRSEEGEKPTVLLNGDVTVDAHALGGAFEE